MRHPFLCAAIAAFSLPLAAQTGVATYELTFTSTWSSATHPIDFPSRAHYSQLVVATHDARVEFWRVGALASPGIRSVAETGGTAPIMQEIRSAIAAGTAHAGVVLQGMASPASRVFTFDAVAGHPRVTVVTMIAPSPDWFVGVAGIELVRNGDWVDDLTVELLAWDAGTDSGTTYASPNQQTVPAQPIAQVTTASGPFLNRPGPIGTFHFRRVRGTIVHGCGVNPAGSMTVDGDPALGQTLSFGLHDTSGTSGAPAGTAIAFAAAADPAFPCGTILAGLGEILLAPPAFGVAGPTWTGARVAVPLTIPTEASLAGVVLHVQAAIADGRRSVLTDAVKVAIGS